MTDWLFLLGCFFLGCGMTLVGLRVLRGKWLWEL
jgi:hypothetical protein